MKNIFEIRYFRNPLENATPYKSGVGERYLSKGIHLIKRKLEHPKMNINVNRASKRIIHGLAYIYGFRYQSFLLDNFKGVNNTFRGNPQDYSINDWCKLLSKLKSQCQTIHNYKNLSSLIRSRYARHLRISNLSDYYHTRRKFVKNERKLLGQLKSNHRYWFRGTFKRMGGKPNGQLTVLLVDIKFKNNLVTDHLWLNYTKGLKSLGYLKTGNVIKFRARVKPYQKGRLVKRYDYALTYPSQIQLIK